MANFEKAYEITMKHEGGYVNDPDDKGGETYCGIARNYHPDWSGWDFIDEVKRTRDIKTCEIIHNEYLENQVKTFYKRKFWDINNLDNLPSQLIANEIFDTGVNMGVNIASKFLQKALNLLNKNESKFIDLKIDGDIGLKTLNALNKLKESVVLKVMNGLQFSRYVELCEKKPVYEKFFYGWLNRT